MTLEVLSQMNRLFENTQRKRLLDMCHRLSCDCTTDKAFETILAVQMGLI